MKKHLSKLVLIVAMASSLMACSKKASEVQAVNGDGQSPSECTADCDGNEEKKTGAPNAISTLLKGQLYAPRDPAAIKMAVDMGTQIHFIDAQKFYTYDVAQESFLPPPAGGNSLNSLFPSDANAPTDFSSLKFNFKLGDFLILCSSTRWYAFHLGEGRFYSFAELGKTDNLIATAWGSDPNAPKAADVLTAFTFSPDPKFIVFMTASRYYLYNQQTFKFEPSQPLSSIWSNDPKAPQLSYLLKTSFYLKGDLILLDNVYFYQFDFDSMKFVHSTQ